MPLQTAIKKLEYLCSIIPPLLEKMGEEAFSAKPAKEKWSKKEIIGHLIDSAVNNHQRFVRVQFENIPFIRYDQNNWNKFSHHQKISGRQVISFWQSHNIYLAEILKNIPPEALNRECHVGQEKPVTLEFIINDYVNHLEYHLKQVVEY